MSASPQLLAAPNSASLFRAGTVLHRAGKLELRIGCSCGGDADLYPLESTITYKAQVGSRDCLPPRRAVSLISSVAPCFSRLTLLAHGACAVSLCRIIALQAVKPDDITCTYGPRLRTSKLAP